MSPPRTVEVAGRRVEYQIVRSPRRRRMTLRVDATGQVELRLPRSVSVAEGQAFLVANRDWLGQRLAQVRPQRILTDGACLPWLDEGLLLRLQLAPQGRAVRREQELWVMASDHGRETVVPLLEGWYRQQAQIWMAARVADYGPRLGVQPSRLLIRGQRCRWGSCSSRGTISLNWRLMLAPAMLPDYVLVHELCHLHRMDHSPVFWNWVEQLVPDWRQRRAALRQLAPELWL